jgi:hypothetical protein
MIGRSRAQRYRFHLKRGITEFYSRAHGGEVAKKDPFALHLEKHEQLRKMYLEPEHEVPIIETKVSLGMGSTSRIRWESW